MKTKKMGKRELKLQEKMRDFVKEFIRKYPKTTIKLARE